MPLVIEGELERAGARPMDLSSAVDWWEKWQLRILVLSSLGIQWLLFLSASCRKLAIPSWFRSIIWLTYLGSDAVAIYGLATLFNRQRKHDCGSANSNSILEVVWAPVLLMHLGGQDRITAYNIQDNELWTRHVLTAVSQITVAIYVFCTSWPGGDQRLLQASILLFIPGILKCIEKPLALKSASFNSLVSVSGPYIHLKTMTSSVPHFTELATRRPRMVSRACKDTLLEDYVQKARALVLAKCDPQARGEGDTLDLEHNHVSQAQGEANEVDLEGNHQRQDQGKCDVADLEPNHVPPDQVETDEMDLEPSHHHQSHEKAYADDFKPNQVRKFSFWWRVLPMFNASGELRDETLSEQKERCKKEERRRLDLASRMLFVDLASSYPDRLSILDTFVVQGADKSAYALVQEGLSKTFDLIYTKKKMKPSGEMSNLEMIGSYTRMTVTCLSFAAIGLFHKSHREAYNVSDVKVTYALLCCTAVLEMFAFPILNDTELAEIDSELTLSSTVAQYSVVGFFVRNRRHNKKMRILSFFNCQDFLNQRWCMKPCSSSSRITELVLGYVKDWWREHIKDAASFRRFSDHRGQWTIQHKGCDLDLRWSLERPFDESVLLWHIATTLCFYRRHNPSVSHENAMDCIQISNYMIYLLFVNPEMLLPGTRRNLFMGANAEVEKILMDDKPSLMEILKGDKPSLMEILKGKKPFLKFLKGKRPSPEEIEREFMQRMIDKLKSTERKEDPVSTEPPTEAEQCPSAQEGFIQDAWKISKVLLALGDKKMWEVIEGVWVEMICFSASRCRGYLHARSMSSGVELLTYVWFLLSRMGMETLPERLQRTELSSGGANTCATASEAAEDRAFKRKRKFRRHSVDFPDTSDRTSNKPRTIEGS